MTRLMGFVTGAAVAVAVMLLVLGMPEIPDAELVAREPVVVSAPKPVAPPPEPAAPAPESIEPEPVVAEPVQQAPAAEPVEKEPVAEPLEEPFELPLLAVGDEPSPDDLKWHAFWSPFNSQIAANGFVSRLEAVTGFDYRVVKVETGVYEVAFAYADDGERDTKLQTISAATGLEIPGS